jgi:hypothetical protein
VAIEAKKGQLAPTKYLLELAGVFPSNTDGSAATDEEDCLAKTLLQRLNITTVPVKLDDDDDDAVIPAVVKDEPAESTGETLEPNQAEAERVSIEV